MQANEKILLVDDEPQVLVALEDALGDDHPVLTTQSANEALALIQGDPDIAVLLTDQRMPEMTGDELLATVGDVPLRRILVTGYADLSAVVRAVNEGQLFAYVTKPWDPDDLKTKVDAALAHYRVARKLEHERGLLADLLANSPDGIAFRDHERRIRRANAAYAQILGSDTPGELVGKTVEEVLGESFQPSWHRQDDSVLSSRKPLTDVLREYPSANGRLAISETVAPVLQPTEENVSLINIARDVTERAELGDALRKSEYRFRVQSQLLKSILEAMRDAILKYDGHGELLFCNTRAEQLLGSGLRERNAENWFGDHAVTKGETQLLITEQQDPVLRGLAGETVLEEEYSISSNDAPSVLVQVNVTPVNNGAMVLLRDITEQRELEEQLIHSQKMEALGQLAGGIAHDFNNLLTAIEGNADLAMLSLPKDSGATGDLEEILNTAQRGARLTRRLLQFGRHATIQGTPTSLNQVVTEVESMLRTLIGERVYLEMRLEEGLSAIEIDKGNLEQLLVNLVVNARDAMPSGGTITLITEAAGPLEEHGPPAVKLICKDTGSGMSPETQAHIFEPFFTTKQPGEGTGLGLATTYGIVTQCGGTITVDSHPGKGTQFALTFPTVLNSAAPRSQPPADEVQHTDPTQGCILLVEDNEAVRTTISRLLRAQGYKLYETASAAEAIRLFADDKTKINLLLTDVVMPDMHGPRLAAELRKRRPTLPVLFMSGYVAHSERTQISPTDTLLEKPFSPSKLYHHIQAKLHQETETS